MLEIIERGRCTDSHPVPLLFVHGAWNAAWCWDEHFLGFFGDRGYRALALSLRGHGGSTPASVRNCSFADYLDDVASVADSLPTHPVLIGHSMGGGLVQMYLESTDAPGAVLMASVPPQGYLQSGLRWIRRHPWHFAKMSVTGNSLPYVNTPELARELFFSPSTPEEVVRAYAERLQEESSRIARDGVLRLPKPERVSTELMVLGALEDRAVTREEVIATARAYCTEPIFFPGMGHSMMLEPGWQAVAECIDDWLVGRGL